MGSLSRDSAWEPGWLRPAWTPASWDEMWETQFRLAPYPSPFYQSLSSPIFALPSVFPSRSLPHVFQAPPPHTTSPAPYPIVFRAHPTQLSFATSCFHEIGASQPASFTNQDVTRESGRKSRREGLKRLK